MIAVSVQLVVVTVLSLSAYANILPISLQVKAKLGRNFVVSVIYFSDYYIYFFLFL